MRRWHQIVYHQHLYIDSQECAVGSNMTDDAQTLPAQKGTIVVKSALQEEMQKPRNDRASAH